MRRTQNGTATNDSTVLDPQHWSFRWEMQDRLNEYRHARKRGLDSGPPDINVRAYLLAVGPLGIVRAAGRCRR